MSKIIVNIESFADFKTNFGDKYCDLNKLLKKEFNGLTFHFMIDFQNINDEQTKINILEGYRQIKNRYSNITICLFFKVIIKNYDSYGWFFNTFVEFEKMTAKPIIKRIYQDAFFYFEINYENNTRVNELLIHNFLLIKNVFASDKFVLNINASQKNAGRISAYIIGHNPSKKTIYLNNNEISLDIKSINKLFPALFIDYKTLKFLQNPVSDDAWNNIKGKKINRETLFENKIDSEYWFLLRACQNYLFDEYRNNSSTVHTALRRFAYTSQSFESHIKSIPLLSLIIFSQYDHYYRNALLKQYKDKLNTNKLTYSDFISALQGIQKYKNYTHYVEASHVVDIKSLLIYEDNEDNILNRIRSSTLFNTLIENIQKCELDLKKEKTKFSQVCNCSLSIISNKKHFELINDLYGFIVSQDISTINYKSFLKGILPYFSINSAKDISDIEKGEIKQKIKIKNDEVQQKYIDRIINVKSDVDFIKNYKIHPEIISELFEAITITEGLLQLIENAVIHANGGLLSMHIYNIENKSDYYYIQNQYENLNINNKFFLEIELSDICDKNMKEGFIDKTRKKFMNNIDLLNYLNKFDNKKDIFEIFFKPENIDNGTSFWEKYYAIPGNQVHHYGLQIFESIIQAKQGVFVASGHEKNYSTAGDIECDKKIPGTSYRILLPLNHVKTDNENIINGTTYEKTLSYNTLKEYYDSKYKIKQCYMVKDELYPLLLSDYQNHEEKEKRIKDICKLIKKIDSTNTCFGKYQLMINCAFPNNSKKYKIELLLKALLNFLFESNSKPPVALYNMSSHDILEATRVIALFFNKNGIATKNMEDVQIYLKGFAIGEEIVFAGENLNWNAERLRKTAMTRGIMYDYLDIAQMLMNRPTTN